MKNTIPASAILLFAVTLAPLSASPADATGATSGRCQYDGWVNGFAEQSDSDFDPFSELDLESRFYMYRCQIQGMRLLKVVADTDAERAELLLFNREQKKRKAPTVLCDNGQRSAMFDLAWVWGVVSSTTPRERTYYRTWATRFARKHDCKVYR